MAGRSFRTVEAQLLLLQIAAEYLQLRDIVPSLAVEIAHRVVELVKVSHGLVLSCLWHVSSLWCDCPHLLSVACRSSREQLNVGGKGVSHCDLSTLAKLNTQRRLCLLK